MSEEGLFEQYVKGEISEKEYENIIKRNTVANKLELGMHVKIQNYSPKRNGMTGTVVHISKTKSFGVEHHEHENIGMGHNCNGYARKGSGWYYDPIHLEIIES